MANQAISARQALTHAAIQLFIDEGFDAVSMEQIRLQAKVSNGSLYHHFPTKAHLARSVYIDTLLDYQQHMMPALDAAASAEEGVRALVGLHLTWVQESPRKALVLERLKSFTAVDGLQPDWAGVNAEAFSHLKSWIAVQVARGQMQKLPFPVWLALVLGPSLQLTPHWAAQVRPVIEPRVCKALAEAAWSAVKVPSSVKGSR